MPVSVGRIAPLSEVWRWLPPLAAVDHRRASDRQRLAQAIEDELLTRPSGPARRGRPRQHRRARLRRGRGRRQPRRPRLLDHRPRPHRAGQSRTGQRSPRTPAARPRPPCCVRAGCRRSPASADRPAARGAVGRRATTRLSLPRRRHPDPGRSRPGRRRGPPDGVGGPRHPRRDRRPLQCREGQDGRRTWSARPGWTCGSPPCCTPSGPTTPRAWPNRREIRPAVSFVRPMNAPSRAGADPRLDERRRTCARPAAGLSRPRPRR